MSKLEEQCAVLENRRLCAEVGLRTAIANLAFNPRNAAARKRMAQLCAEWCSVDHDLSEAESNLRQSAERERGAA